MCTDAWKQYTPSGIVYRRHVAKPMNQIKRQIKDNLHSVTGKTKMEEQQAAAAAKARAAQDAAMRRANAAQTAARNAMEEAAKRRATHAQSPIIGSLEEEKKRQKRPTIRAARRRTGAATGKRQFIIPAVNVGGGSGPMNV